MYYLMNPSELNRLKVKIKAKDFTSSVSSLHFSVKVVDILGNTLQFNKACEVLCSLLQIESNYNNYCSSTICYPSFSAVYTLGSDPFIIQGYSSNLIELTLITSTHSPIVKVPTST